MNKKQVPRFDLGSFLSERPRPPKPPKPPKPLSRRAQVQQFLDAHPGRWFSLKEIADALSLTIAQANDGICAGFAAGGVKRSQPAVVGRKNAGQTYSTTKGV